MFISSVEAMMIFLEKDSKSAPTPEIFPLSWSGNLLYKYLFRYDLSNKSNFRHVDVRCDKKRLPR